MFKLFVFFALLAFAFAAPKPVPQIYGGLYGGLDGYSGLGYSSLGYGYPYGYGSYGYGFY
ncbi:prismalin-14-like [Tribolium madens]|uniref:prismalin-14-like n=1 Tax=Tribolium madens TaxID=41895 RepID=UPI001CF759EB|nr:prismalin-14-like [Tribolium madens]